MRDYEIAQTLVGLAKEKPVFVVMVGCPGSGKSTMVKMISAVLPSIVCNTDDTLEARAKGLKIAPHEAHGKVNFGQITAILARKIWENTNYGKNVIVDQTSMTAESRAKKLKLCQTKHFRICIDMHGITEFSLPELSMRIKRRFATGGRFVPDHVIEQMLEAYEQPVYEEGFDFIFNNE
jgi:predicted kinase